MQRVSGSRRPAVESLRLPFAGYVVWLTWEQGGRKAGPPMTPPWRDHVVTAYVPPWTAEGVTSLAVRLKMRGAWRSPAEAGWLLVDNIVPQRVDPGSVIVLTDLARAVGYFHVESVTE